MKVSSKSWHYRLAEDAGYLPRDKSLNIGAYLIHVFIGMIPFIIDFLFVTSLVTIIFSNDIRLVVFLAAMNALYMFYSILLSYLQSEYYGPFFKWGFLKTNIFKITIID
jgi:mannose/fructose/N-acetylgalactosamine-specific phosphotransferase system component IIC